MAAHTTSYAPPVLRAPSPASSVGTSYGADQTSLSDSESQLPQDAFERKWIDRLGLGLPRAEETQASIGPLIYPIPKTALEEKAAMEGILHNLRHQVQQLEENELLEQQLLRGSQAALEQQPTSNDIDALMRSMMMPGAALNASIHPVGHSTPANNSGSGGVNASLTDGPWTRHGSEFRYTQRSEDVLQGTGSTSVTASRKSAKGKGRIRRL